MNKQFKTLVLFVILLITSCVYRPDLQQGNLLNIENIDRIQIDMTKSQIKYLLGGPVVGTPYEENRWDYIYLYQPRMDTGSNENSQRYWLIVYFENEKVVRIDKDVETIPN
jgi:outer membrane protein assembly factor BamE